MPCEGFNSTRRAGALEVRHHVQVALARKAGGQGWTLRTALMHIISDPIIRGTPCITYLEPTDRQSSSSPVSCLFPPPPQHDTDTG